MQVKYDGIMRDYSYIDLYLGKERAESQGFKKYCEKILLSAQKRRSGLIAKNESTENIDTLIEYCQTQTTSF